MAARHSRRVAGKPPEEQNTSGPLQNNNKILHKKPSSTEAVSVEELPIDDLLEEPRTDTVELPFMEEPTANKIDIPSGIPNKEIMTKEPGFNIRAPLQADDRAKELLKSTLRHPINLTAEDLLNVSEPMRQELKRLLTKKRVERKSVAFATTPIGIGDSWKDLTSPTGIKMSDLPEATCEILSSERDGLAKGAVVIGDPVSQYLATLKEGEKPKPIRVAEESQSLRAIYPRINGTGEAECLLDSGSQIISMAKEVAKKLAISWNPDITIEMESANKTLNRTLGLAKDIPVLCGYVTVYLQIHILANPAYKVLLGRPFDIITESLVKNAKDGSQTLTLTDPNTGERCVMFTYERGKVPDVMRRAVKQDF